MGKAYLHFWGVRGSYASPFETHLKVGGNTSCVEIRNGNDVLICDAGTGIIPFGNEMMAQDKIREIMIILTHYHWDHICGLPFFVPAFVPDWKINIFGPGQTKTEVKQNLDSQMQAPYFPVGTETWMANINYIPPSETELIHGAISITRHNVHHPGVTYGYRIQVGDKTIIYVSDNECQFLGKSIEQRIEEFSQEELEMFETMNREEYEFELGLIKGADILIHDAQYTPEDYEKKRGWGHSCYIDAVNSAIDAGVKDLYLYHHDPYYNDDAIDIIYDNSQKIIQERSASLNCHIAREGMRIDLD
ncbi:MAG: MBL fold metallo-hydrolase [Gammaproteobacteria bacterium]